MSSDDAEADAFLAFVERIASFDTRLSQLQAAILAAAHLDLAHDTRSFANKLGVSHALVLRELTELEMLGDLLAITRRDARTLRTHYELTADGKRLLTGPSEA
ncbi:hypothetical protein [Tianweitania sediminis]|uniref:Formate dehydrogenase F4B subunit n=1 Tax=Tianweitania sediminis TaxID=1502156 RepID=A0A8J7RLS0_9HYPH|nr:hypothetical protein [Tianweitania sediminis]MBP0438069.1 hypothetical protein [Tianweitania sediminis]